jgi:hypothetical protein
MKCFSIEFPVCFSRFFFLLYLLLEPEDGSQCVPLKFGAISELVSTQKTMLFLFTAIRTSNPRT